MVLPAAIHTRPLKDAIPTFTSLLTMPFSFAPLPPPPDAVTTKLAALV